MTSQPLRSRGSQILLWGWRMLRLKPKTAFVFLVGAFGLALCIHERHGRQMLEASAEATANVVRALGMKSTASFVLPDEKTVIMQPAEKSCENFGSDIFALFMVISAPAKQEHRDVIRSSLGTTLEALSKTMKADQKIKLLFFIGLSGSNITDLLRDEFDQHGDIVVDNMVDTYLNLTVKTLRMLKWTQENCREAQFLIKVDDDVHVNVPMLLNFLENLPEDEARNLIAGHKYDRIKIVTDPTSKWYTPKFLWPGMRLPYFTAGFFYVLGIDAIPKLYNASLRTTHLFHLEDVFLTGVVATNTLNMGIHHIPDISIYWNYYFSLITSCFTFQKIMAIHQASPEDLKCWNQFNSPSVSCGWKPVLFYC